MLIINLLFFYLEAARHGLGFVESCLFKDRKTDQPIACLENDSNQATNASLKRFPDPYLLCVPLPFSWGSDLFRHCRGQENPWWNVRSFFRFFGNVSLLKIVRSDSSIRSGVDCFVSCLVARTWAGWTGQILRTGAAWETAAHAAISGLVFARKHQPWEEEEAQTRYQWWRYPNPSVPSFPYLSFLSFILFIFIFGLFFSWTVFLLLFLFLFVFLDHLVTPSSFLPERRTTPWYCSIPWWWRPSRQTSTYGGFLITVKIIILCLFLIKITVMEQCQYVSHFTIFLLLLRGVCWLLHVLNFFSSSSHILNLIFNCWYIFNMFHFIIYT